MDCFNPVLGFLSASTELAVETTGELVAGFNPVLGFLSASTGGKITAIGLKKLSQELNSRPEYVDQGCTVM